MCTQGWIFGHGFLMPWMVMFPIMMIFIFFAFRHKKMCNEVQYTTQQDEALSIARRRFAKGEIDEETFDKIREKLVGAH